jgi:hypothetical protein
MQIAFQITMPGNKTRRIKQFGLVFPLVASPYGLPVLNPVADMSHSSEPLPHLRQQRRRPV